LYFTICMTIYTIYYTSTLLLLLLLLCSSSVSSAASSSQPKVINLRPIIGILAQPSDPTHQYIDASYVKWMESAGARVVPVFYNSSQDELNRLFSSINALLFTGGLQTLQKGLAFYDSAKYLFELAVSANKRGDYFPVWGTCQGFQFLHVVASGVDNETVLGRYDSWNISYPLDFTATAKTSRLFGPAPSNVLSTFSQQNSTMNWHHYGLDPTAYKTYPLLNSIYNILSTNYDRNNKQFVSAIEGKDIPIYGTQFHPEYTIYQWDPAGAALRTKDAMVAMQYLSDFFVEEARKNAHQFATADDEAQALIYNYHPDYSQTYIF